MLLHGGIVLLKLCYLFKVIQKQVSFSLYGANGVVDLWSVGCILAELLGGRPFFKGRDYVDQLNQILHFLGTPNEETLSRIGSSRVQYEVGYANVRAQD